LHEDKMPLPQASSSSDVEKKEENPLSLKLKFVEKNEENPPSLKLKFKLSTLSRKLDDDDDDDDDDDNDMLAIGEIDDEIKNGPILSSDESEVEGMMAIATPRGTEEPSFEVRHFPSDGTTSATSTNVDGFNTGPEASSSIASIDQKEVEFMQGEVKGNDREEVDDDDDDDESMEFSTDHMNAKVNVFGGGGSNEENLNGDSVADGAAGIHYLQTMGRKNLGNGNDEELESRLDEDEKNNTTSNDAFNRPTRTRSSYENKDATVESSGKNKLSNVDNRKDDTASVSNNGATANNASINNGYSTTSRSQLSAEREILGFRDPPSSATTISSMSFLDSLSEDQRRVRVRHLPNITGFRRLHKSEIKRDQALVKKMIKKHASNSTSNPAEESNNETESMEIDGEGAQVSGDETPSDEDLQSSTEKKLISSSTVKYEGNVDIGNVFSLPFIQSPYLCTDFNNTNQVSSEPVLFSSPQVVESISAFNPPRPPESVGPKKLHRLNRWERAPQDVEVDLSNYRKTVNRTRQELHKAEKERGHLEVVSSHLRSHLLTQLKCMRQEMKLLGHQYDVTQINCIKAAELLTSKTRSRGAARGSYVMKDILSVLKSRGEKLNLNSSDNVQLKKDTWCVPGIGGVSHDSTSTMLGSGWVLPGDKVSTPYGSGVVEKINAGSDVTIDRSRSLNSQFNPMLISRVCVKLPFGSGYFHPSSLTLIENSDSFSDNKLSSRWLAMLESAKKMGTVPDFFSVDNVNAIRRATIQSQNEKTKDAEDDEMTESSILPGDANVEIDVDESQITRNINLPSPNNKAVSFSAGILPVGNSTKLADMEKNVEALLKGSSGVLGKVSMSSLKALLHYFTTSHFVFLLMIDDIAKQSKCSKWLQKVGA
jgi:hypothetical protein